MVVVIAVTAVVEVAASVRVVVVVASVATAVKVVTHQLLLFPIDFLVGGAGTERWVVWQWAGLCWTTESLEEELKWFQRTCLKR